MKKSTKIWLGILTFLPLLFVLIFFIGFATVLITQIPELERNTGEFPAVFLGSFFGIFLLLFFAALMHLGVMIYYIVHVSSNSKNDSTKIIMWILLLIFVGTIGNIMYYFLEIYPLKNDENSTIEKSL
jgi:hypothetical protein